MDDLFRVKEIVHGLWDGGTDAIVHKIMVRMERVRIKS
jgi:hypothetical protein